MIPPPENYSFPVQKWAILDVRETDLNGFSLIFTCFPRIKGYFWSATTDLRSSGPTKATFREGSTVPATIGVLVSGDCVCWGRITIQLYQLFWCTYSRVPGFWPTIRWSTLYIICVHNIVHMYLYIYIYMYMYKYVYAEPVLVFGFQHAAIMFTESIRSISLDKHIAPRGMCSRPIKGSLAAGWIGVVRNPFLVKLNMV